MYRQWNSDLRTPPFIISTLAMLAGRGTHCAHSSPFKLLIVVTAFQAVGFTNAPGQEI